MLLPLYLPVAKTHTVYRTLRWAAGILREIERGVRQVVSHPRPTSWPRLQCGRMWDPPTMNSVSREPQLPQRHLICTSGTYPRPAAISAARSASLAWRHDAQGGEPKPPARLPERPPERRWRSAWRGE
jgi:hypothetical protein